MMKFTISSPRSGTVRTNLSGELAYQSFVPTDLEDVHVSYTDNLVSSLTKAHEVLTELRLKWESLDDNHKNALLDAKAKEEAEASVILSRTGLETDNKPEIRKLGVISIADLLKNREKAEELTPKEKEDASWLQGAYQYAHERLAKFPLVIRLTEEFHDYIMHAPSHAKQTPGEFRRSQTWLGSYDSVIKNADFIFPNTEDMKNGLESLEKYLYVEDDLDSLIRISLFHYQFEALHPFLDGNGRVGRFLNALLLEKYFNIPSELLTLSVTLKKQQTAYYRKLRSVEETGDYEGWIQFWTAIITETAQSLLKSIN